MVSGGPNLKWIDAAMGEWDVIHAHSYGVRIQKKNINRQGVGQLVVIPDSHTSSNNNTYNNTYRLDARS